MEYIFAVYVEREMKWNQQYMFLEIMVINNNKVLFGWL